MSPRSCSVSFTGPNGVRHTVEVTAESVYEAAALGVSLLRQDGWSDTLAPGTLLEIRVAHPATTHAVTIAEVRRWTEGIAASPNDVLRKNRLKRLLDGHA